MINWVIIQPIFHILIIRTAVKTFSVLLLIDLLHNFNKAKKIKHFR